MDQRPFFALGQIRRLEKCEVVAESVVCTRSYNESTNMNFAENSSYEYIVHMEKLSSVFFYPCQTLRVESWMDYRKRERE